MSVYAQLGNVHGQNPIEWLNFMAKQDIDTESNEKYSHKTASLSTCFRKLQAIALMSSISTVLGLTQMSWIRFPHRP